MVRGIEEFLMELVEQPDNPRIAQLMEICYQSHLAVHRALAKAGAHFTSMGDSLAGPDVTSPRMFDRFARPYEERLVKDLAADGIFVVIHICGDTSRILDIAGRIRPLRFRARLQNRCRESQTNRREGPRIVWKHRPQRRAGAGDRGAGSGSNPAAHFRLEAGRPIHSERGLRHPPTTPPENLHALIDTAKECGVYD